MDRLEFQRKDAKQQRCREKLGVFASLRLCVEIVRFLFKLFTRSILIRTGQSEHMLRHVGEYEIGGDRGNLVEAGFAEFAFNVS